MIRASIFKKAGDLVARALRNNDAWFACEALTHAGATIEEEEFFAKLFKPRGRSEDVAWFGSRLDDADYYNPLPHEYNQMRRILALYTAYHIAKDLKK